MNNDKVLSLMGLARKAGKLKSGEYCVENEIKKGKAKVAKIKGDSTGSIYARYISSLAVGLQLPLKDLLDCTVYQINDLLERYSLWTN